MKLAGSCCVSLLIALGAERCESLTAPAAGPSARSEQTQPCPRPTDKAGQPLYESRSGRFVERRVDEGGGRVIVLTPPNAAANESVRVTDEVFDAVEGLERGRNVMLFGYVSAAASGAAPTYSCIELP